MAIFGRRRDRAGRDEVGDDVPDDVPDRGEAAEEAAGPSSGADPVEEGPAAAAARPAVRPQGPWDVDDLPEEDTRDRVDLGALRVPVSEDVELRVDLDPAGSVVAATLVHGEEVLQLGAFAAPRTEPIWGEVREEIADSLRGAGTGGSATEVDGPWGVELRARIPTDQPGVMAAARFVGVDGPRWFLRGLLSGPLTTQGQQDPVLAEALRGVVVVRGPDAMPPREALPLRLPKEAQVSAEAALAEAQGRAGAQDEGRATLPPLAPRGPEITETG